MGKKISAGLLMYRQVEGKLLVFLAHPGGPYFKNKDIGQWTIPKGEVDLNEELLIAAIREFREETGIVPEEPFVSLGSVKRKDGKVIHAWAFENRSSISFTIVSNSFLIEWPPKSGKQVAFPEIDKAEFFNLETGKLKINAVQKPFIERLVEYLKE